MFGKYLLWGFILAAVTSLFPVRAVSCPQDAPASVAGTYANLSFNVNGMGGQNRFMSRLALHKDGKYEWGKEKGAYEYRGGNVYLSGSYAAWGPGKIDKDHKIWFEFTKNGKHYTVTMYRASAE